MPDGQPENDAALEPIRKELALATEPYYKHLIDQVLDKFHKYIPDDVWENFVRKAAGHAGGTAPRKEPDPVQAANQEGDSWTVAGVPGFPLAPETTPWSFDASDGQALIDKGGMALYGKCHLLHLSGGDPEVQASYKAPCAKIIGGQVQVVWRAAVAVYVRLKQDAFKDLSDANKQDLLSRCKAIYTKAGKDTADMALSLDRVERFVSQPVYWRLADAPPPADPANKPEIITNDKGWLRKVILRTGDWPVPPPGGEQPLSLSLGHLQMIKEAFDAGAFERVCVPIGHGNDLVDDTAYVTATNTGYVMQLDIEPDPQQASQWQLVAWLEFTDQTIKQKIADGSIWNVSVLVLPNVQRPSDGKVFPLALKHVALTNYPWMSDLGGFSQAPANLKGALVLTLASHNRKEGEPEMPNDTTPEISPEKLATLLALEAKQTDLAARERKLAEDEAKLAGERKTIRVAEIMLALEGKGKADGVSVVDGYRHCPAVVEVAHKFLDASPAGQTLRLSADGKEQSLSVEALVLAIINALPEAARMKLEAQPTAPKLGAATTPEKRGPQTPEEAAMVLKDLGL